MHRCMSIGMSMKHDYGSILGRADTLVILDGVTVWHTYSTNCTLHPQEVTPAYKVRLVFKSSLEQMGRRVTLCSPVSLPVDLPPLSYGGEIMYS